MAVRPYRLLDHALIMDFVVASGQTVAIGRKVKQVTDENTCQHAGAGEVPMGTVISIGGNTAVTAGAAGDRVQVALDGNAVVPMKIGTGGSTFGVMQQAVSDGITDVTPNGAPTTGVLVASCGLAMQTGVAADVIGVLVPGPSLVLEE